MAMSIDLRAKVPKDTASARTIDTREVGALETAVPNNGKTKVPNNKY